MYGLRLTLSVTATIETKKPLKHTIWLKEYLYKICIKSVKMQNRESRNNSRIVVLRNKCF